LFQSDFGRARGPAGEVGGPLIGGGLLLSVGNFLAYFFEGCLVHG
jgi:hypothetical protein